MRTALLFVSLILSAKLCIGQKITTQEIHALLDSSSGENKVFVLSQLSDFFLESNADSCLFYAHRELEVSRNLNFLPGIARGLNDLAYGFMQKANFDSALSNAFTAIDISKRTGKDSLISNAYQTLGVTYYYMDDYISAKIYLDEALSTSIGKDLPFLEFGIWMNLGRVYLKLGKVDSALIYTQKSYETVTRLQYDRYLGTIYNTLGEIYITQGKPDLANSYFIHALENATEKDTKRVIVIASLNVAKYYKNQKQLDSAIKYAISGFRISDNYGYQKQKLDAALILSECYDSTRNSTEAFQYLKIANQLQDSLLGAMKQMTFNQISEKHRLEEMSEEHKLNEARKRRQQNIHIAILITFFIAIAALVFALTQTLMVSSKWVSKLTFLILLLGFELLYLILHITLGRLTHEEPIWLFFILFSIAYWLHPIQKKLERGIEFLVEKYKRERINKAQETIKKESE